jgi:hypothetical protein
MTHQQQTGTGRQPPAFSRARGSRKKLPAARRAVRLAALAASLSLLLAVAGAASAGTRAAAAQAASKDSFVFAGYEVTGPATSASARFTVPALACPRSGRLAVYPGVELSNEAAAIIAAGVRLRCQNGTPVYAAVIVANNTLDRVPVTVSPGDQIAARVTQTATAGMASIADLTRHFAAAVPATTGAKNLIADVGVEAVIDGPAPLRKVPPFGTITFSAAKVNGTALGASHPAAINRTFLGTLQILTGPLDSTGTSFTTTFKHT